MTRVATVRRRPLSALVVVPLLLLAVLPVQPPVAPTRAATAVGADVALPAQHSDGERAFGILFGSVYLSGTATIRGTASEAGNVSRVEVRVGDLPWATAVGVSNWHYEFETTLLSDGKYWILARPCTPEACSGHVGTAFIIDNTPPTVSVVSPLPGGIVPSSRVEVEWRASDAISDVDRVTVRLDGGDPVTVDSDVPRHTLWGVTDGLHTVEVTVFDYGNNSQGASIEFSVDTNPWSLTGPIGTVGFLLIAVAMGASVLASILASWRAGHKPNRPRP